MKYLLRASGVILSFAVIVMGLFMARDYFDRSDVQQAMRILSGHTDQSFTGLECRQQLLSRYEGRVLVECATAGIGRSWVVDIQQGRVVGERR